MVADKNRPERMRFRGMIRQRVQEAALFLAVLLLSSCGGGGGGYGAGGGGMMMPSPSDLQYPAIPPFTINKAIAPVTPTVVGQVSGYTISPKLPLGLSISGSTGVISGTPVALAAQANYTVTATNSAGSTTAMMSIVVNDVAPSISYQSPYFGLTANVPAQISPTVKGGTVVGWQITPSLPAGLALGTDGSISGAATAASGPTTYTVKATNSGGPSTAMLTLNIADKPLLDLGHENGIELIRYAGSDLISLDGDGHWTLQVFASGATLASGDAGFSTARVF
jgi:hypothetical protein